MANPTTTPTLLVDDFAPAEHSKWSVPANLDATRRIIKRLLALAAFIALWELASTNKIHFLINFAHVPAPSVVAVSTTEFARGSTPDSGSGLDSLSDPDVSDGRAEYDLHLFPRRDLSHSPEHNPWCGEP
jgi:hypothetical protein